MFCKGFDSGFHFFINSESSRSLNANPESSVGKREREITFESLRATFGALSFNRLVVLH